MEKNKVMVPTNDYIFKRIFGHVGNEDITKGLLTAILKREIKKVELKESPILEKDLKDDKIGILDIKAKLDDDTICNIEMQVVQNSNIEKRIMFYWSKLYFSGIREGENYNKLNKTIVILIANFELDTIKEISKYHTKWEVREEEYSKIILTNVLEIHIIELPKLNKYIGNSQIKKEDKLLNIWLKFILNPDEIGEKDMNENKEIKKAKEELSKIQQDEHEEYLAHLRQKHILDTKATEEFGYLRGKKEGIEEGIKKGKQELVERTVLNMHRENINVDTICKVTNLKKKEVEKIISKAY